ncbi:hypothetical protein HDU96_006187, partial [Phlyctochytrium bullatum]
MTRPIAVVIGILQDTATGKVFVTRRSLTNKYFPGYWVNPFSTPAPLPQPSLTSHPQQEFPGGKVESTDTSHATALSRELLEEIGIKVTQSTA